MSKGNRKYFYFIAICFMNIKIEYDKVADMYTAVVDNYNIITEWKTWDDLLINVQEAIQAFVWSSHTQEVFPELFKNNIKFYFDPFSKLDIVRHAAHIW